MLLTMQCKCTITKMTPAMQGRNEWGLGGHHSPGITMGALNHCGGRHKVPTMSQILSSMQYICFRKTSCSNMVAPNLLLAQWRSQPKNLGGATNLGGTMFDFRRITLFCLEKRLSKDKMTIFSKNFGEHDPFRPPWLRLCSCPGRHLTSLRPCCDSSCRKNCASMAQQCFFFIHASFHTAPYKTTVLTASGNSGT